MAEALQRWKKEEDVVDDITCIVVFLDYPKKEEPSGPQKSPSLTSRIVSPSASPPVTEEVLVDSRSIHPTLNPMLEAMRVSAENTSAQLARTAAPHHPSTTLTRSDVGAVITGPALVETVSPLQDGSILLSAEAALKLDAPLIASSAFSKM
jgi:hypothetical protein